MESKKSVVLLLTVVLVFVLNLSVLAQAPPNVSQAIGANAPSTPFWTNVNNITLDLSFDNGVASCTGIIAGMSGTSNIDATFKLERSTTGGWSLVKSWNKSSSSSSLTFWETNAVTSGHKYRLTVTAVATKNGVAETVSTSVEGKY